MNFKSQCSPCREHDKSAEFSFRLTLDELLCSARKNRVKAISDIM